MRKLEVNEVEGARDLHYFELVIDDSVEFSRRRYYLNRDELEQWWHAIGTELWKEDEK